MKNFSIIIVWLFFIGCSTTEVKRSKNLESDLKTLKRIVVVVENNRAMAKEEIGLIFEMTKNYISHHKEFIVYVKRNEKFSCKEDSKIQGIFTIRLRESQKSDQIAILAIGQLVNCKTSEEVWSGLVEKTFPIDEKENASLVKTYTEKFGNKIQSKVTPYFLVIKKLLDNLENPVPLSEDEQNEKIEIESES
ncbi:MAG: MXAN_6521/LA_1396 family lipoprotein [Leptospiraceae bacterium]|nr:MXAN_6521/LA_1396 family lipoprotein [Leptospiraceae bacterium]MCK6380452.1 MXAN_6521/LA_1396 family lipoprotein [Leptospiraceae bacterium]